jgi:hypothetical protein
MLLTSSSSLCASDQGLQISIAPMGPVLGRAAFGGPAHDLADQRVGGIASPLVLLPASRRAARRIGSSVSSR